ncbi:hypothetical protein [Actinomadura flavalba]|uniref:hypothetical protein n=1 Tax=Actinomadura flavalba TaxID=1120938 RepID=UPI0003676647|nr:hypothetical protein [Actinomadura flavalba]
MTTQKPTSTSPQARGRELARAGRQLWQELGSVKEAAAELMNRHPDIPSLQAHRYACGLSQDQAAQRYNEATDHQTSLGGTTINSWETWARGRGRAGSPPNFPSLLVLSAAYGKGPLGVADEQVSPGDLVAEGYERLAVEDQISLKHHGAPLDIRTALAAKPDDGAPSPINGVPLPRTQRSALTATGQEFDLAVPMVEYGNPVIKVSTLPNAQPGQLLHLNWTSFGSGLERLIHQIKNIGRRLDVDACFGINEAGLVMATFLASAQFGRCPIGYLKCNKARDKISLDLASAYPDLPDAPSIVLCDFEVKRADVIGFITREIRSRYPGAEFTSPSSAR